MRPQRGQHCIRIAHVFHQTHRENGRLAVGGAVNQMNAEAQLLCMMAGANSIFFGEKLLTAGNPSEDADAALFQAMGV